ncbi:MAG: hypothetical protein P1V81_06940 [Planctomycetota bacterium]|nr:hypothetical protein [Planctomycetota bacterium]
MHQGPKKHTPFPDTRWSLVGRSAAADDEVRREAIADLVDAYLPGLRAFLIKSRRLQADLADDVLQDFVADRILTSQLTRHADASRGKFRSLIVKALNNFTSTKLAQWRTANSRAAEAALVAVEFMGEESSVDHFETEWLNCIVQRALESMRHDCRERGRDDIWDILELRVAAPNLEGAEPVEYDELVRRLKLDTPRQAINLLGAAKKAFTRHFRKAVAEQVGDENVDAELADLMRMATR